MSSSSARFKVGLEASLACSARPTGVENYARSLLSAFVEAPHGEFAISVYLPPFGDPGCLLAEPVKTSYRPDVNTGFRSPWLVARSWLDRTDLLFTFGHKLPRFCRGLQVIFVHDTIYEDFPDCYLPGEASKMHNEVKSSLGRAHAVAVNSQATANALRHHYGWGGEIMVLGGAARPTFCPGPATTFPLSLSSIIEPFFLFVGRMDRRKNVSRVVEAYRELLRRKLPVGSLVLVGPPDSGSPELLESLSSHQVEGESILLPGYLKEDILLNLYRRAAAFVFPSLAEGFGLPILEAMACGTATITSNRSSLVEVAGNASLLVDPENIRELCSAMQKTALDLGFRSELIAAGLRQSASYTWDRCAQTLKEGFRSLLGRNC